MTLINISIYVMELLINSYSYWFVKYELLRSIHNRKEFQAKTPRGSWITLLNELKNGLSGTFVGKFAKADVLI